MFSRLLVFALVTLTLPVPAQALKMRPFTLELTPSGRGATNSYQVENDTGKPIAVQVVAYHRTIDAAGKEKLVEAEDEFVIYPPQMILKPRTTQTVRIQWVGEPQLRAELPFRVIVEQLPVKLGKGNQNAGSMDLLVRYQTTLYVAPKGFKENVAVSAIAPATGDPSKLSVTLQNLGTRHVILADARLSIAGGPTLSGDAIPGFDGTNLLPGASRRLLIPRPKQLSAGPWQASVTFKPLR